MVRNPLGESGAKGSPFALAGKHLAMAARVRGKSAAGQPKGLPIIVHNGPLQRDTDRINLPIAPCRRFASREP